MKASSVERNICLENEPGRVWRDEVYEWKEKKSVNLEKKADQGYNG